MIAEAQTKSANFLRIVSILRRLRNEGTITVKEYDRAKKYYQQLTGADIILADQRIDISLVLPHQFLSLYFSL